MTADGGMVKKEEQDIPVKKKLSILDLTKEIKEKTKLKQLFKVFNQKLSIKKLSSSQLMNNLTNWQKSPILSQLKKLKQTLLKTQISSQKE